MVRLYFSESRGSLPIPRQGRKPSAGTELSDDDKRLPFLYCTPELHKSSVNHRFVAGSSKCTTKQLLNKILTVMKTELVRYCSVKTSHNEVGSIWILKSSISLLLSLVSP